MIKDIITSLPILRADSGKHLNQVAVSSIQDHKRPNLLVIPYQIANADWAVKLRGDVTLFVGLKI